MTMELVNDVWEVIVSFAVDLATFECIRMLNKEINNAVELYLSRAINRHSSGNSFTILPNGMRHGPYELCRNTHNDYVGFHRITGSYYWDVDHGTFREYNEEYHRPYNRIFEQRGYYHLGVKVGTWYKRSRSEQSKRFDIFVYRYNNMGRQQAGNYYHSKLRPGDVFIKSHSLIRLSEEHLILISDLNRQFTTNYPCRDKNRVYILLSGGQIIERDGKLYLSRGYKKVPFGTDGSETFHIINPFNNT